MLAAILIFLSSLFYPEQIQPRAAKKYDTVDDKSIHIKNIRNAVYSLGSAVQLQQAFGKIKALKEKDEMLGGYDYTYKYNGLVVSFNEKEFEDVAVKSPQYNVYLNTEVFKIGDTDAKLKKVFPLAYAESTTEPDHTRILRIQTRHGKILNDAAVVITLSAKGAINEIWIGNDNS